MKLDEINMLTKVIVLSNIEKLLKKFYQYDSFLVSDGYEYVITQINCNLVKTKYVGFVTSDVEDIVKDSYDLSALYNSFEAALNTDFNVKILEENKIFGVLTTFNTFIGESFYKSYE